MKTYTKEIDLSLKVRVTFTPGRPAPHCNNPDDPRFSDPGDGPELDWEIVDSECPSFIDDAVEAALDTKRGRDFMGTEIDASIAPDDGPDPDDARDAKMDMDEEDRRARKGA